MMPRVSVLLPYSLALVLGALPAGAVTVSGCSELAGIRSIAEPWEANTRPFAKGDIRMVMPDTIEPAAAAFHRVVPLPPRHELGSPSFRMVSASEGPGFGGMDIGPATASYDTARGLAVALPSSVYCQEAASFYADRMLSVTINQATGQVQAVAR